MSDEMAAAVRKARNQYNREWRKKNPGKIKEYNNRYWERRVIREQAEEQKNGKESDIQTDN